MQESHEHALIPSKSFPIFPPMSRFFFAASLVFLSNLSGRAGDTKEAVQDGGSGQTSDERRTVDGEMLVKWEEVYYFDTESQPFTGRAYSTFEDGTPRYDANIINGRPDGLVTIYHENGNKLFCAKYKNGVQQGLEENWHENGQLQFAIHYDRGLRHGKMTSYHDDGRRQMDIFFVHGKIHGPFIVYDKDGEIASHRIYHQGKLAFTRKSPDYEVRQVEDSSKLYSDILEKGRFKDFQSNNPGYPKRILKEAATEMELTTGDRKKLSAHIWLNAPIPPPFELTLEYLAIPTKSNALNFGSSALAIHFAAPQAPDFMPGIEEDPGLIPGTGGYTLQMVTNSRWKGTILFGPNGKRLERSRITPSTGRDWRHLRIIAGMEKIIAKIDDTPVIEIDSPQYQPSAKHLAITASNGKVSTFHAIRNLNIHTKLRPGMENASQELNSHPVFNEHRMDLRTVGFSHVEKRKNHLFYEIGKEDPFTGKTIDYFDNGTLKIETHYLKGFLHGKHSIWYPDGTISIQAVYADGETCIERKWDAKGNILP